jgi:hypothetical protein
MIRFGKYRWGCRGWVAVVWLGGLAAQSAEAPATPDNGKAKGRDKTPIAQRGVIIPRETPNNPQDKPGRGNRPDKTQPAADVKQLVAKFQKARDTYLEEQQALLNQLKTASEAKRAVIRDQLRDNLEQWKEQQKDLLREQRERAQELKRELQADLGKVVDEAKGEGRGR